MTLRLEPNSSFRLEPFFLRRRGQRTPHRAAQGSACAKAPRGTQLLRPIWVWVTMKPPGHPGFNPSVYQVPFWEPSFDPQLSANCAIAEAELKKWIPK